MEVDYTKMAQFYHNMLCNEVIPYWLTHAIDNSGALNNCLAEDGTVLSKDRYIWSQGRALWTFSAMYNRVEKRTEYKAAADGLFQYLDAIYEKEHGVWNYRYDVNNNRLDGSISIYVDGFVLCGMTEYYAATGNQKAKEIALAIYEDTRVRLQTPDKVLVAPYVIPEGMKTHGVNMIFSFFYDCLGKTLQNAEICDAGYRLALEVLEQFYVPEKDAVLEFVNQDGTFSDTPEGRTCVPGHVIECMWFLLRIFESRNDIARIQTCCRLIKRHIQLGLDRENGGLSLALDIDGKEPVFWQKHTYKPWWVHSEALVATAAAYKYTHDTWFMDMHESIRAFAFAHYPNGYGDWINWLDHDGNVAESAALPVKDPFHLPRALIYLRELFSEINDEQ